MRDFKKTSILENVFLTTSDSAVSVSPGDLVDFRSSAEVTMHLANNTAQDIRELENEISKQEYINKYLESYNKL